VVAAAGVLGAAGCGESSEAGAMLHFRSRPDLTPPVVTVATSTPAAARGDVFIAPKQDAIQKGPEILDDRGEPVWFKPVPGQATDFRVQTYEGRPVLTWWEGPPEAPVPGSGVGHGVIYSSSYRQIARVDASFGPDTADLHEFQLTPRGTALLTVYRIVPRDLSSVGGPVDGKAVDGLVEEIDIKTGRLLFRWHSLDHVALSESYSPPPPATGKDAAEPYDYFHINSIDPEPGDRLLVSARNTHTVYEIDERTGAIVWRLGGKKSSFEMGRGASFAWQHDARLQPDGTITLFDDEASPQVGKQSRAIRLRIDTKTKTATLVQSFANGTLTGSQGNAQVLPNGDTFVGWGAVPRMTEFSPTGMVVFDATFTKGDDSYRAYRFAWSGSPSTRPAVAAAKGGGESATLYASWNGATAVTRWQALAGVDADNLHVVGRSVARDGFETTIQVTTGAPYLAVAALDAGGRVLARSAAVPRGGVAVG
jgi:Arylsulfotransferase (ASST)